MQILDGSFFFVTRKKLRHVFMVVHARLSTSTKPPSKVRDVLKKNRCFLGASMRVIDLGFSLLEYVVPMGLEKYLHG